MIYEIKCLWLDENLEFTNKIVSIKNNWRQFSH